MAEKTYYQCDQCHRQAETQAGEPVPECCGRPMREVADPLDQCTLSSTAEHSRFDDGGGPCDDGRAG
ncbi:hypothetical protein [Desulfatitalea tepidiphila]|jgi:hypothetical protein|uniref:hypothetical protein n=1 Tax=Desulfatitalea tepidiphila TaxID=1185843 RepID=UPI0006B50EC7|nr:hypothetical protein [Desulfatitalea tepidiphila]